MDILHNLIAGFGVAFQLDNLLWAIFGVVVGNLVGVLPGLGVMASLSILLPLTYTMTPTAALIMLAGIFYGSQYGGGITAVMLNLPGTAAHAVTCLDGHPMARQGRAGAALFMLLLGSFFGATCGILLMIFLSPALSKFAFQFGPAEYFSMMLLGLIAGSTLAKGSALKSLAMVILGVVLGLVGIDVNTGTLRFTMGFIELSDGLSIVILAMGFFGLADFLRNINNTDLAKPMNQFRVDASAIRPAKGEVKKVRGALLRGTSIGSILGVLPGAGAVIASFIAYATEKRVSKTPKKFGDGAIEGLAGPESATSSAAQTSFIPTLTLGIPGDPVMAIMLGALIIHGIQPGPRLITAHADIFWGLIASFWLGNILLILINYPLINFWVKIISLPFKYLYPTALFFICVGVYSTNYSFFDVSLVIVIGFIGYFLLVLDFEAAPLLLGFILGPMVEENFRRTLVLSEGDLSFFVQQPISLFFLVLCALVLLYTIYAGLTGKNQ